MTLSRIYRNLIVYLTQKKLRILSKNHALVPPFIPPHESELDDKETFDQFMNTIQNDIRNHKQMMNHFQDDHNSRETHQIVNEYLYDQEQKRIEEEIKFNIGKEAALKKIFNNGSERRKNDFREKHQRDIDRLNSIIKPISHL